MNKMVFFFFLSLVINIAAFGQNTRKVGDFSALYTSGDVRVELIKANEAKVEFTMIKGKETDLITEVNAGELKVKIKNNSWGKNGAKAEVKVYYNVLEEINASAGSSISSKTKVNGRNMEVICSSGARITVEIDAEKAKVVSTSGSKISLTGAISEDGAFDVSSGGNIDASNLTVKNVSAKASSGGRASVWAVESINADTSSGGNIKYKGEPKNKKLSNDISGGNIGRF